MSHPVTVVSAMKPFQQTTATNFTMTASLRRNQKGINMSRLTEAASTLSSKRLGSLFFFPSAIYERACRKHGSNLGLRRSAVSVVFRKKESNAGESGADAC